MNYQNKKRLSNIDKEFIKARYSTKLEEYKTKTIDELKDLFQKTKMSSTDRQALIGATNYLIQKEMDVITNLKIDDNNSIEEE